MAYEAPVQPKLRLSSFKVSKLNFELDKILWEAEETDETEFNIQFTHIFKTDDPAYFAIIFAINIFDKEDNFRCNFDFIGHFEVQGENITQDTLRTNPFFRVSAPAIVFPFIRSFVSTLTMGFGFKPLILPSINFSESYWKEETVSEIQNSTNK